jgi:general secretion pathway protein G
MRKGFTLIEMLVIIAIVAILAAIVWVNTGSSVERSKVSGALNQYKSIKTAANAYFTDVGQWPANTSNGLGFVTNDSFYGWAGPYLEKWPTPAPWGGSYNFLQDNSQNWVGVGIQARYLRLTGVKLSAVNKIDSTMDGGDGAAAGVIHYTGSGNNYTVDILISND